MDHLITSINDKPDFPCLFLELSTTRCITISAISSYENYFLMVGYDDIKDKKDLSNLFQIDNGSWLPLVKMIEFITGKKAESEMLKKYEDLLNQKYYKEVKDG